MRFANEVRACLSEMLHMPVPEPSDADDPVRFFKQWLAERNLGLVPVADADAFDWPGQWVAVFRDSEDEHALVMFGSPSGVWLDPSNAYHEGARIEAGWMLTPLDLYLPRDRPYETAPAVGSVAAILIAHNAEAPLSRVDEAEALAGHGLAGDRYGAGRGTFSAPGRGYQLTLVEAEVLDEVELAWEEARRNIVTRGISVNGLVGRRFRIGSVECIGRRLAEPCRSSRETCQTRTPPPTRPPRRPSRRHRRRRRHPSWRRDRSRRVSSRGPLLTRLSG